MSANTTAGHLRDAVHRAPKTTKAGINERLFTAAFEGLVYPCILEDPRPDIEGLQLGPGSHLVTIASGGCNILNYLTADTGQVSAVDLNRTHVALAELKIRSIQHIPEYDDFFRLFGTAADSKNPAIYDCYVREHLSPETRAFWEADKFLGRRRITMFEKDFYARGTAGRFFKIIGRLLRLFGADLRKMAQMNDIEAQRAYYRSHFQPLLDHWLWRWLLRQKSFLFGLGIPPAQWDALTEHGQRDIADVVDERFEFGSTLVPAIENYFLWRAASLPYASDGSTPLPAFLQRENFEFIKERASRATVTHQSLIPFLQDKPEGSITSFVLLDAQDWMDSETLTELWTEITRVSKPGARVVFRTAGKESILPGMLPDDILGKWRYLKEESERLFLLETAAVYGGLHLYEKA